MHKQTVTAYICRKIQVHCIRFLTLSTIGSSMSLTLSVSLPVTPIGCFYTLISRNILPSQFLWNEVDHSRFDPLLLSLWRPTLLSLRFNIQCRAVLQKPWHRYLHTYLQSQTAVKKLITIGNFKSLVSTWQTSHPEFCLHTSCSNMAHRCNGMFVCS